MERQILHIDVNNAFLSWTAVDMLNHGYEVDIRKIPAVIGGDEEARKGIVLAKSIPAKKLGIVTAETLFQARRKCPDLKVFHGNFKTYEMYSNALYEILLEYTDKIERFSIDECFLDMTSFLINGKNLLDIANEISKKVKTKLGFTVNIGVAHNKLLAKMASDFEKPDRVHTLYENEIEKKMWPLPISELFMIGKRSAPKLLDMGIFTIGDLAKADKSLILKKFGKFGKVMWEFANGIDESEVAIEEFSPKGIGNSVTLPYDTKDMDIINGVILSLSEQVGYRLRKNNLYATTVSVQIKTKDFVSFSHQRKLNSPSDSSKDIFNVAKELFYELKKEYYIRLVGVRVQNLVDKCEVQVSLFETAKSNNDIDLLLDKIKDKYGYKSVLKGSEVNIK